ncbi:hypothetical protein P10VF_117 [Rhizobium phage vB_RleM_P10VF]|uniref:Uncharacterized protein n=1 Tax=Rhizobium phage vB_RleM_P10VF TaxID=1527770 RepID=A0A076YLV7_9CAUD|nr:hypothetical protein P10VF_117 [Rhizobium phage vB_RleM_P10VF]AIK68330.1 hypothetical protein P10VF_117 [Rhizobium phage vB_RleM_P10VF]
MSQDRSKIAYRSWMGFRLMFQGTDLGLDDSLVPIVKVPEINSRQRHAVVYNMSRVLRNSHQDTFPLFFAAVGLRNRGEIPYPLSELSEKTVDLMHRCLREMFDVLSQLEDECRVLWRQTLSYDELFDLTVSGDVSVPAAACYAKKFQLEKLDIGNDRSLLKEQTMRVYEIALKLEKNWNFFKLYRLLVKNSLHNFDI